jgi:hypothetical protein
MDAVEIAEIELEAVVGGRSVRTTIGEAPTQPMRPANTHR